MPFVLLVEDDPDDREFFIEAFKDQNPDAAVQAVANGEQMLSFLEVCGDGQPPALILLDYKLPILNAPDILRRLKAHRHLENTPIFVWSTSQICFEAQECKKLGALEVFRKPTGYQELVQLVRKISTYLPPA